MVKGRCVLVKRKVRSCVSPSPSCRSASLHLRELCAMSRRCFLPCFLSDDIDFSPTTCPLILLKDGAAVTNLWCGDVVLIMFSGFVSLAGIMYLTT